MDLSELIKKRTTKRKFDDTPISDFVLKKIIEAGIFGPSILALQPWEYVVVLDKQIILKISDLLLRKSSKVSMGVGGLLYSTSKTVRSAPVRSEWYRRRQRGT